MYNLFSVFGDGPKSIICPCCNMKFDKETDYGTLEVSFINKETNKRAKSEAVDDRISCENCKAEFRVLKDGSTRLLKKPLKQVSTKYISADSLNRIVGDFESISDISLKENNGTILLEYTDNKGKRHSQDLLKTIIYSDMAIQIGLSTDLERFLNAYPSQESRKVFEENKRLEQLDIMEKGFKDPKVGEEEIEDIMKNPKFYK